MRPMLIQIQRWLMQPKVWRFVGLLSTIVGLLCYAVSSFTHLFGKWNLLKVCLYSVSSFIICVLIFFANEWQVSHISWCKAHMAFLVLTTTSVYSFFFDKVVHGKPDIYSLISCGAFAMMSLSLSRQTLLGVEVDLLYFFLGCLIVQLMKIKWLLAVVGAGFSYSLIIIRSSLDAETDQPMLHDHILIRIDSQHANTGPTTPVDSQEGDYTGSTPITTSDVVPENGNVGLQDHLVTQLTQVDSHSQQAYTDSACIMPQLMECIDALNKENQYLISMLFDHVKSYLRTGIDPQLPQADPNLVTDLLPLKIIKNLNETVKLMVAAGFEEECCHAYSTSRGEFIEAILSNFDLHTLNCNSMWTQIFNIVFKILFPNERTLCDRVFAGFPSSADLSFLKVCRECTIRLPKGGSRTGAKRGWGSSLLYNLDLLKTIRDIFIPELKSLFPDQYNVSLKDGVISTWNILKRETMGIFKELEDLIDWWPEAVLDELHPITREVMYRLRHIYEGRDILELVLKEHPMVAGREGMSSSLSVYIAWIMEKLDSHLVNKSKSYTDSALGYLFMVNNGRYIVQKAKEDQLETILGNVWIQEYTVKVQQYLQQFQSTWNKVLSLLNLDNNESVASMKEKLTLFNRQFEQKCWVLSICFVLDEKLREEIKKPLDKILRPAYENFIKRFRIVLGRHADQYVKYSIPDLGDRLNNLFLPVAGQAACLWI